MLSQILSNSSTTSFHDLYACGANGSIPVRKTHKCCVYIPNSSNYCAHLFSIQSYSDINRDVSLLYWLKFSWPLLVLYWFSWLHYISLTEVWFNIVRLLERQVIFQVTLSLLKITSFSLLHNSDQKPLWVINTFISSI